MKEPAVLDEKHVALCPRIGDQILEKQTLCPYSAVCGSCGRRLRSAGYADCTNKGQFQPFQPWSVRQNLERRAQPVQSKRPVRGFINPTDERHARCGRS